MTCAFCDIAAGRAAAHFLYEDAEICAFADNWPIRPGHVQIIPRAHFETFEVIPEEIAFRIMKLGQRIATVQKRLFKVERVGFVYSGHDVAHAHAHLIPLHDRTDLTSLRYFALGDNLPLLERDVDMAELAATAACLRAVLQ